MGFMVFIEIKTDFDNLCYLIFNFNFVRYFNYFNFQINYYLYNPYLLFTSYNFVVKMDFISPNYYQVNFNIKINPIINY